MKQLYITNRDIWREWLSRHHATETELWLIFYKNKTGKPTISYEDAVEEALCFGWIDSIIKKIDTTKYARKFTPRKDKSNWSALNKKRANKMVKEARMTDSGLAKIRIAKKIGLWNQGARPQISLDLPPEFAKALSQNKMAQVNFNKLSPSHRKHYVGWIAVAKREETKRRRIKEAILLLEKGEKLGLK